MYLEGTRITKDFFAIPFRQRVRLHTNPTNAAEGCIRGSTTASTLTSTDPFWSVRDHWLWRSSLQQCYATACTVIVRLQKSNTKTTFLEFRNWNGRSHQTKDDSCIQNAPRIPGRIPHELVKFRSLVISLPWSVSCNRNAYKISLYYKR